MSANDRLGMLDEFGGRKQIIPAEARGRFRKLRDRVYFVLLIIFLALPWIRINGLQALRFDIPNRRFEIFGGLFLAHDTPLLFFILAIAVLAIAVMTALFGRAWCGWACPQTVFIDAVYRRIERWIEGDYIARRKLAQAPMSARKARLFAMKWLAFFLVSSLFAHSFIAYFTGSRELVQMIQGTPAENWSYFLIVTFVTALLLFDFGWFREQFCVIMCPYGRFQSVLLDSNSLNVAYDEKRGEPRKGREGHGIPRGDCVACNRCVQVCPTGIDIRHGIQMECIACTACIDACDEIMTKVGKPTGLIGYRTQDGGKPRLLRPRVIAYSALILICAFGLAYNVSSRMAYSATILRAKDAPYQVLQDERVMNHFKAHVLNQSGGAQNFRIRLAGQLESEGVQLTQVQPAYGIEANSARELHLFVTFPRSLLNARGEARLSFEIEEAVSGESRRIDVIAVGPYSSGS